MNLHKVVATNVKTGEAMLFASLTECAVFFKTTRQYIYECIQKGRVTRKGYTFDYPICAEVVL